MMNISFRHVGNTVHAINLMNIAVFAGFVVHAYVHDLNKGGSSRRSEDDAIAATETMPTDPTRNMTTTTTTTTTTTSSSLFDPAWLEEGFCQPQNTVPLWTTHDQSGYVMLAISVPFLLFLWWSSSIKKEEENPSNPQEEEDNNTTMTMARKLSFWATVGAIGHAFGHILISFGKRQSFYPPGDMTGFQSLEEAWYGPTPELAIKIVCLGIVPSYFILWLPLVKTYMLNTPRMNVLFMVAALAQGGALFVPQKFGFAYTQIFLFASTSMDQVLFVSPETKQTIAYALWPLMTVVPNGMLAWVESTACTSHVLTQRLGHVTYDLYMSLSYVLFYLVICLAVKSPHFSVRQEEPVSNKRKTKVA